MNLRPNDQSTKRTAGYTLLELLLALGLTVVIVSLIATAIRVNGLTLSRVQASIERKQAARGILSMMQNDLRAGIQYKANEYAGLQDLFQSIQLASGQSPASEGLEQVAEGLDGGETADEESDTEFVEAIEEPEVDGAPVFIGQGNFVSIDISRLPRIDEYHPSIRNEQESSNTLADVKTVSYFVSQSNGPIRERSADNNLNSQGQSAVTGGLFRRQVDRSVATFEGLESTGEPDLYSELVAPEVVEVSFRYFDGADWFTEWDSEENGGFPLAVEMYVFIDPARAGSIGTGGTNSANREDLETYRAVVHIPAAEIVDQENDDE